MTVSPPATALLWIVSAQQQRSEGKWRPPQGSRCTRHAERPGCSESESESESEESLEPPSRVRPRVIAVLYQLYASGLRVPCGLCVLGGLGIRNYQVCDLCIDRPLRLVLAAQPHSAQPDAR
jgi:hypothetical protein